MFDLGFRLYFFDLKDEAQQRRQHLWAIQYDHLHNGPPFSVTADNAQDDDGDGQNAGDPNGGAATGDHQSRTECDP